MILLKQGNNTFYINNNGSFIDEDFSVEIESSMMLEKNTINLTPVSVNERFITFNMDIDLEKGQHQFNFTQGANKTIMTELVFVEFDEIEENTYTAPKKTRVYKKA